MISEQASLVCEQIGAAVAFADSEEDLRIEVEKAIEVFRKDADLPQLKGDYEVTIATSRADGLTSLSSTKSTRCCRRTTGTPMRYWTSSFRPS